MVHFQVAGGGFRALHDLFGWGLAFLATKVRPLAYHRPKALTAKYRDQIQSAVEYWRVDDVLDLFKGQGLVAGQVVGNVKQVKSYRDWVAHRNPQKPPPSRVDPKTAHAALRTMLTDIGNLK